MGATIKEFLRLVEEFVSMIGMQMSGFQEIYETTENLGEPQFPLPASLYPSHVCSEWFVLSPPGESINLNLAAVYLNIQTAAGCHLHQLCHLQNAAAVFLA